MSRLRLDDPNVERLPEMAQRQVLICGVATRPRANLTESD
jgi:hypothetical protein